MRQLVFAGLLLAILAGCQRTPAPSIQPASDTLPPAIANPPAATVSQTAASVAARGPVPTTPLPEGTDVTYQCADGNEVTVTYSYVSARLRWPDGRKLDLSRAASPSKAGGDVYSGHRALLQHDGAVMQLSQDGGAAVSCSESSATA